MCHTSPNKKLDRTLVFLPFLLCLKRITPKKYPNRQSESGVGLLSKVRPQPQTTIQEQLANLQNCVHKFTGQGSDQCEVSLIFIPPALLIVSFPAVLVSWYNCNSDENQRQWNHTSVRRIRWWPGVLLQCSYLFQ